MTFAITFIFLGLDIVELIFVILTGMISTGTFVSSRLFSAVGMLRMSVTTGRDRARTRMLHMMSMRMAFTMMIWSFSTS